MLGFEVDVGFLFQNPLVKLALYPGQTSERGED